MSNDTLDDAKDFITAGEAFKPITGRNNKHLQHVLASLEADDAREQKPGQPTQYALYNDGYTATTPTVETLPPGCYEIKQDDRAVFVSPMLPPSGLLLDLPEMKSAKVLEVLETFWNSEKDYKEGNEFVIGGAQYKGGALLFGPGGSGKSSILKLAAKKMVEKQGTVFYASCHPSTVLNFLTSFAKIENNRKCVVILEDLDTLIEMYGESQYLEMLDSAKTIDNVFFIATTNYPERLDPRVYNRPGRFSHVIKIGLPSRKTREAYLKAVLKNYRDISYIVEHSEGFTIDHLSQLVNGCYREKKDLHEELKRLKILFKVPVVKEEVEGFGLNQNENQ